MSGWQNNDVIEVETESELPVTVMLWQQENRVGGFYNWGLFGLKDESYHLGVPGDIIIEHKGESLGFRYMDDNGYWAVWCWGDRCEDAETRVPPGEWHLGLCPKCYEQIMYPEKWHPWLSPFTLGRLHHVDRMIDLYGNPVKYDATDQVFSSVVRFDTDPYGWARVAAVVFGGDSHEPEEAETEQEESSPQVQSSRSGSWRRDVEDSGGGGLSDGGTTYTGPETRDSTQGS